MRRILCVPLFAFVFVAFTAGAGESDFNGDGKTDLVFVGSRGDGFSQVAVWLLDGSTRLATASLPVVPENVYLGGTADFDGNGTADILWHHRFEGTMTIWLMTGTSITSIHNLPALPHYWLVGGVGDVTGDGKPDIVVYSSDAVSPWNGYVAYWQMDGLSLERIVDLYPMTKFVVGNEFFDNIAGAADFNRDGTDDILIVKPRAWRDGINYPGIVRLMDNGAVVGEITVDIYSIDGVLAIGDFDEDRDADALLQQSRLRYLEDRHVVGEHQLRELTFASPIVAGPR